MKILLFSIHANEGCVTALYHQQNSRTRFIHLIKETEQFSLFRSFVLFPLLVSSEFVSCLTFIARRCSILKKKSCSVYLFIYFFILAFPVPLSAPSIIPFLQRHPHRCDKRCWIKCTTGQGDAVGWSQNVISVTAGGPQTASVMHFYAVPRLHSNQSEPDWLNWFAPV